MSIASPVSPPPPPGPQQGQPPSLGSSPATQPMPNKGAEAAGLTRLSIVVKLLGETIPLLEASSDVGKDVVKAFQMIAKHIPAGTVSPAVEQGSMQRLMMQQRQMAPQVAQMRQQMAQQPQQPPAAPPEQGDAG